MLLHAYYLIFHVFIYICSKASFHRDEIWKSVDQGVLGQYFQIN